jgi:putative flippase GtrA
MVELFKRLFIRETNATPILLFRYGFVALSAFSVDFGGLILLHEKLGMQYLLAATLSFCLGVNVNYLLSTGWIFKDSKLTKRRHEFVAVLLIATVGLVLNDAILWALTSGLALFYVYSKLVATVATFFWNFFVRKKILHDTKQPEGAIA